MLHESSCRCVRCRDELAAVKVAVDGLSSTIGRSDWSVIRKDARALLAAVDPLLRRLQQTSGAVITGESAEDARARLKELVEEYGSAIDASKKLGISQQTISNILRGASVGRDVAKRVAAHDRGRDTRGK